MKVLIPNVTSKKNIGDLAITAGLLRLIRLNIKETNIIVHSSDHQLHDQNLANRIDQTIYSWVAFEKKDAMSRIVRSLVLLVEYIFIRTFGIIIFKKSKLFELLTDYKSADLIIFAGGGYLRSKAGLSQSLNLIMQLAMFKIATSLNKQVIVAPISVGPFAYGWQESLTAKVLRETKLVTVRESVSYDVLKKYNATNCAISSDHAFFNEFEFNARRNENPFIFGFTARTWLPRIDQTNFENFYAQAVIEFSEVEKNMVIQPIVQVQAPEYGEDDFVATEKIAKIIKDAGLKVMPIIKLFDIESAVKVYSGLNFFIGMRMHSNILSVLCNVPVVAIAYEYKTEGIMNQLGVGRYCINVNKVDKNNLFTVLVEAYQNRFTIKGELDTNVAKIKNEGYNNWSKIFSTYVD